MFTQWLCSDVRKGGQNFIIIPDSYEYSPLYEHRPRKQPPCRVLQVSRETYANLKLRHRYSFGVTRGPSSHLAREAMDYIICILRLHALRHYTVGYKFTPRITS
jgi:hypothetical protein